MEVGNIIFDHGKTTGVKQWSEASLRHDGDYFYDAGSWRVKLRSDGHPATRHPSIELTLRKHIIDQSGARLGSPSAPGSQRAPPDVL